MPGEKKKKTLSTFTTSFQITQNHVVERLLLHYKGDLVKVIKEQRLPYNIDVLAKIRRDCFIQNFSDPNSLQNKQVQVCSFQLRFFFSKPKLN